MDFITNRGEAMKNYINYENAMYRQFFGLQPVEVLGQSNYTNYYYKRYLYNKIYSCFDFKLLNGWALNTFRFCLFHFGSIAIFKRNGGWNIGAWSPKEYDNDYNPIKVYCHFFFENTKAAIKDVYTVGEDAFIVKIFDDYLGFDDLVRATSTTLANCEKAIDVALMNANVNLYATVDSEKKKVELQNAYAAATQGQPLVFIDKDKTADLKEGEDLFKPWTNHDTVGALDRILTCRRTIVNNFLTEIGIKNANTNKKERLISDEVNENNEETSANVTIAFANIKSVFDAFNKKSGLSEKISVDLHYDYNNDDDAISVGEGADLDV